MTKITQRLNLNAGLSNKCTTIMWPKQGDAIQGNMEAADINFFNKFLIPGKAYRISRFTCIQTENWQQTLENTTSLFFTRFTKFHVVPADAFPPHYFNFVAYNQLPYRVIDPDDTTRKEYPILTGHITHSMFSIHTSTCTKKIMICLLFQQIT